MPTGMTNSTTATTPMRLVLLAATAAVLAAGACEERPAPPAPAPEPNAEWLARLPPWPACPEAGWHQRWYRLDIQDQPAGSERQRICERLADDRPGLVFEARGRFAFVRDGVRLEHLVQTRAWLDERGRLLRLSHRTSQPGQVGQLLQVGRIDDALVAVRGPELRRVPLEPDALAGPLFQRYVWFADPITPGNRRAFRSFSHRTAGYVDNTLEVVTHTAGPKGRTVLKRITSDAPSVTTWLTLDAQRTVVSERADFGKVRIESKLLAEPPAEELPARVPDLSRHMRVETLGRFSDPDRAIRAHYRLTGLPAHVTPASLDGPGQKVVAQGDGAVEVVVTRVKPRTAPMPLARLPDEAQRWLRPTALAQAADPKVKALAERLARGQPDSLAVARRLRAWVTDEIEGDMGMTFASATDVLAAGKGDCSEKAVLLVALARAVGLPARAVAGLVYNDGRFAGHMWTEIWLGHGWLPLDAAWGPEQVSAARIRLGVDPLELGDEDAKATERMAVMVSGVKVKILAAASVDAPTP